MAFSTIPAAKTALLALLQADVGLTGVLVARGVPAKLPVETERVYIDNAVDIVRDWNMIGRLRLDESYTIRIPIEVFEYDANSDPVNQQTAEDRMWEIAAVVELAIKADPTLGGTLNGNTDHGAGMTPGGIEDQNSYAAPDGWVSHAVLRIDCAARI